MSASTYVYYRLMGQGTQSAVDSTRVLRSTSPGLKANLIRHSIIRIELKPMMSVEQYGAFRAACGECIYEDPAKISGASISFTCASQGYARHRSNDNVVQGPYEAQQDVIWDKNSTYSETYPAFPHYEIYELGPELPGIETHDYTAQEDDVELEVFSRTPDLKDRVRPAN